MSTTGPVKVCRLCQHDVSNAKRVKDPQGNYYCQACFDKAQAAASPAAPAGAAHHKSASAPKGGHATTAATAKQVSVKIAPRPNGAASPPPPPPAPPGDELDFADPPPRPQPARAPAAAPAPASTSASPAKFPDFCPSCGAKVIANRRLCVKCQRDVTKPVVSFGAATDAKSEAIANWVGRGARVAIGLAIVAFLIFSAFGLYQMFFASRDPFDLYPRTREAAVREFLGHIAKGTDKDYNNALNLISFRVRHGTHNENEDTFYKVSFARLHDDFQKKYGSDWISKLKVTNEGGDESPNDEEVMLVAAIGEDRYPISVQVQIPAEKAMMDRLARKNESYPEDGKRHFGISLVWDYPPHPRPKEDRPRLEIPTGPAGGALDLDEDAPLIP